MFTLPVQDSAHEDDVDNFLEEQKIHAETDDPNALKAFYENFLNSDDQSEAMNQMLGQVQMPTAAEIAAKARTQTLGDGLGALLCGIRVALGVAFCAAAPLRSQGAIWHPNL